ncbi:electron transfer flavoprotein-ubiquinone oxidoreductase [Alloacidobacterium dinghuense]|uniref:Electron transfer flavoprotein-ubiquinone oxidoreductase n=1 Tax=Alloacidobacterium dinghuense TaxID=2763107 RepID=A0A7G8BE24_9BACT|nr:electron transfer flavoprotein-ubiquinone oxidoreductase [Alloacidobacterium dinghuense]QNI30794.1 electron transfer flavoprotein-ubiquinone oxidoreductase [Alloacidobacterium dinghuense]
MITFRKPIEDIERPQMEADVVIIGGGPAGMACALRLSQLIDEHNAHHPDSQLSKDNVYVLEKAREVGQHCLSGALLDPRSMRELLPGFESEAPLDAEVTKESVYFLSKGNARKFPMVPQPLRDHGNYVISINKFVKWLGQKVEEAGITVFTGFAGSELLFDDDSRDAEIARVAGVRTDDKGVDKQGQQKSNFEPGYDLRAKITILAEGTRGNCAKQLIERLGLEDFYHAQTYGVGIKELWEIPAGRVAKGEVIYTLGYPLTTKEYGGAWIYGISDTQLSIGYVTGLDYEDPRTDPHHVFQDFKEHPLARRLLEGGKMIRYGAKTLPYGGWLTMPRIYGNGWMILGDSASFLNSQRLKGIHLAIKSGMLAAETAFDALLSDDSSADTLSEYKTSVDRSWIYDELYPVRNFHQAFEHGLYDGLVKAGIQQLMRGGNLGPDYKNEAGYLRMKHADALSPYGDGREHFLGNAKGDGKLTFDRLTDVYHSGTRHDDDQPVHLVVKNLDICNSRCGKEFGNPCQYFCPAAVYEMVESSETPSGKQLHINFANCVHCKTCDIMDPYQIINWVPPEGGGGPNYDSM